MSDMKRHAGSCQCGRVAFECVSALDNLVECNCSHCYRKGLVLSFVPLADFTLLSGADALSEHMFNKHQIRHQFCKHCGVQSFAHGQNPDGSKIVAVNVRTLTDVEPWDFVTTRFDGRNY